MARVNAQEYTEKWSRRMKGATQDITAGIDRVTRSPGAEAAKAKDRMKQNLMAAIDDGTWEAQVAKVSLEDWRSAAKNKGVARIAVGVDAAVPKLVGTAERLLQAVDQSVAEANQIPRGNLEDNITRMTTFVRGMAKRKIRRPR